MSTYFMARRRSLDNAHQSADFSSVPPLGGTKNSGQRHLPVDWGRGLEPRPIAAAFGIRSIHLSFFPILSLAVLLYLPTCSSFSRFSPSNDPVVYCLFSHRYSLAGLSLIFVLCHFPPHSSLSHLKPLWSPSRLVGTDSPLLLFALFYTPFTLLILSSGHVSCSAE